MELTKAQLAKLMDHTILKADATKEMVDKIVDEAIMYNTASVCINPYWVEYVHNRLKETDVKTCTVIGFPLGANTTATKVFETKDAIENGADEIDMVINIGELKSGNTEVVFDDIKAVCDATHEKNKILKVIIETALLNDEEKRTVIELCVKAGVDFVKTSTGFSTAGAKEADVALMRTIVGQDMGVKASGGIHNYEEAISMLESGANRLGVSASVQILADAK